MFRSLRLAPACFFLVLFCGGLVARAEPAPAGEAGWRSALPGWEYIFPGDHAAHRDFKTEWWYFTGNLRERGGEREFGYQLTFFRQGILRRKPAGVTSRFAVTDLLFAHFAVSNLTANDYSHFHRWSRGAFGEAGTADVRDAPFDVDSRLAWVGDWELRYAGEGAFELAAREGDVALRLNLRSEKRPVFHGADGISQKAQGEGRASHYYSFTRLSTEGILQLGGDEIAVVGTSWFDHEWATNQLAENQVGWDWFSLQFDGGSELMLFQIRSRDGGRDPFSSGTWVQANGDSLHLDNADFFLEPESWWQSDATEARYPVAWRIRIPKLSLDLHVRARLDNQEFLHPPIFYWEGAVRADGEVGGTVAKATGYLEMTGYAGPIVGMQAPSGTP